MRRLVLMTAMAMSLTIACSSKEKTLPATPLPVEVAVVAPIGAENATRYSANIRPNSQVDVAFRVGGYVTSIGKLRGVDGKLRLLQEGDIVRRGTSLATVRQADYRDKVTQGRAGVSEASAAEEQARRDFERAQKLFDSASITRPEYESSKARFDAATARLQAARAMANEAQSAFGDSTLTAPIDGVLLRRSVEEGALVTPGTTGFVIADVSSMKVVFGVPDTLIDTVKLGDRVAISTSSVQTTDISGQVTRVSPSADPKARIFEVEVTMPNSERQLKAGMVVSLQLGGEARDGVSIAVPMNAIVRSPKNPKGFSVFVLDGEVAKAQSVTLGNPVGNLIEVTGGLGGGERVVTRGASLLADGQRVRVIDAIE